VGLLDIDVDIEELLEQLRRTIPSAVGGGDDHADAEEASEDRSSLSFKLSEGFTKLLHEQPPFFFVFAFSGLAILIAKTLAPDPHHHIWQGSTESC
jgi:hypothetical protein